ncbi:restriction endonuclease [Halapricum desulfuricans]|uniref:Restriction endonuclease type IV Mrr domain-containing protein n=1 Tax=Halapricum desulfuricans TaxID=2841257 RepID=A0A897NVB2_9EURY|nr:restriction endonuclease [Halapricum desulfuricans]QSG16374.1 Uncharacterized protein HSEST_3110 [Halapricum desulfuricans]
MDDLEFALANFRGYPFEKFAMAYLREQGYQVHESGSSGPDGGWDGQVEIGGREGIAHASVQETWRRKLRSDAEKVEQLEEERGEDYDLFVFVTNQDVGGRQELDLQDEIREGYGWKLRIHHREEILGELRQNSQDLAEEFLDVDLQKDHDHIQEIEELCSDRLDKLQARDGYASELIEGPAIALHIIPNGVLSKSKNRSGDLPNPSIIFEERENYGESKGKHTISYGRGGSPGEHHAYAVLRNDGLYESASVSAFHEKYEDLWLQGFIQDGVGIGLDAAIILAARETMMDLSKMGFSGTAFAFVSLLDTGDVQLVTPDHLGSSLHRSPKTIDTDRYTTEYATLQIGSEQVIEGLEPVLDELWRQFGDDGSPNIEDGKWTRQSCKVRDGMTIEEGDR